jgi:hypothetical protein
MQIVGISTVSVHDYFTKKKFQDLLGIHDYFTKLFMEIKNPV